MFVSLDVSEDSGVSHYDEPWIALPWALEDVRQALQETPSISEA